MNHVTLRGITAADLPALFENSCDPEAIAMAGFPARELAEFLAHRARIEADPGVHNRAIVVDGDLAGDIGSWRQDDGRRLCYWLARRYWGRGIATAALTAFLTEVTERPIHADVLRTNVASIRVLEKCGFRLLAEEARGPDPDPEEHTLRLDA
jgi:RimJ/RimL family protein N-acetyltransferase